MVLAAGLWLLDAILQPIPMPAGGAALFGWLGFWPAPRRLEWRSCAVAFAIGALVGVAFHVRSHIVEDRVETWGSLALHALGDLAVSAVGAALVLALALEWVGRARRASEGG